MLPLIRIVPCHIRTRIGRRRGVRARRVSRDPPRERNEWIAHRLVAVAVRLIHPTVIGLFDVVLYDIRREELRRDPACARRVEPHIQIVLRHAVRIEDVVVGKTVEWLTIRIFR